MPRRERKPDAGKEYLRSAKAKWSRNDLKIRERQAGTILAVLRSRRKEHD